MITSIAGSSAYFQGSLIPYSYNIKSNLLDVSADVLKKFGAVSEETITEMAIHVRDKFNTDIGVATSGVAGPGGGTDEKPVGTVWIAYSDKHRTVARKLQLSKDRMINIRLASVAVEPDPAKPSRLIAAATLGSEKDLPVSDLTDRCFGWIMCYLKIHAVFPPKVDIRVVTWHHDFIS